MQGMGGLPMDTYIFANAALAGGFFGLLALPGLLKRETRG
jgi:hypothetical protein